MRLYRWLIVSTLVGLLGALYACSGGDNNKSTGIQCSDDIDNDGDGQTDFPDDEGCTGEDDESEDSSPSPQCKDGRDNDGDGKRDFPNDPGCFAPQQDSEEDDCPDGVGCPQCGNNIDDDMNGLIDFPNDPGGCTQASDIEEYTRNPTACGGSVTIEKLAFDGKATGTLMAGALSNLQSPTCGGSGTEKVYEFRVNMPKVVVATTDTDGTTADTVVYIRGEDCANNASELSCHNDISTTDKQSTVSQVISTPGTYYIVVDAATALGGNFELHVNFFVGEGTVCQVPDECGPGLVCRIPKGGSQKICMKHICEDGMDEDGDGKNDFPDDPGCANLKDDDETDTCPGVGPTCPECSDGVDNDGDGMIDYGATGDPTCSAASSASESCVSSDGVTTLTMASTMDTSVGAINDVKVACSATTAMAPDKTYRLDLPPMVSLNIDSTNTASLAVALYDSTCAGTALQCDQTSPEQISVGPLPGGAYYYVVDGNTSTASGSGAYTINISGKIQNGASCESPLALSGAITCDIGYSCQGATGSKTCQPAVCSDGIDNAPTNGKIDFPFDPGCTDPADATEGNPTPMPVCNNGMDDDGDGLIDYGSGAMNDYGCAAASGTTEAFCTGEVDPTARITTKTQTGTTTGKNNNSTSTCNTASSTAPDVAYALILPVPVATLVADSIGSSFDSVVHVRSLDCSTLLKCDDQGGGSSNAKVTMTGVAPGGYAVYIDGWSSGNGNYTLNVQGTVAPGTKCDSPLFTGGANAVLLCPAGTTCTGTPLRCQ